jgi:hypothetical protein
VGTTVDFTPVRVALPSSAASRVGGGMSDQLEQRRRGYLASRRMTPLGPCGCIRHPDVDKHRCDQQVTDVQAEAAAAAIRHLQMVGAPGLLDDDTCRAMWRIGFRELAAEVCNRSKGLCA